MLHPVLVQIAIRLRPRPPDGRPLPSIKHPEVNARPVDASPHDAPQRVDLLHEVALPDAANRRVAGHLADRVRVLRHERGPRARSCCGGRGLAARVAAADDDDVVGGGRARRRDAASHGRHEAAGPAGEEEQHQHSASLSLCYSGHAWS
jgi:hypothetical protein